MEKEKYNVDEKRVISMSVQNDCYILYALAVGEYAQKHELSEADTYNLFQKKQVMAQIIAHHEYFHQLDFTYTMEYVEKIVTKEPKQILFHGTVYDFEKAELQKSRNILDFGKGFYTTVMEAQAAEWGERLAKINEKEEYFVNLYSFRPSEDLKIKQFNKCSLEWLKMVEENRLKGGINHEYDVVFGPVADDNTMPTVIRYFEGSITAEEALKRLEYTKITNQVSFHTKKAIDCLWFLEKERRKL